MFILWVQFVVAALIIILAAVKLSKNADIIAEKTGLGRAWVGALLLPIVTSLPEIVTSAQAVMIDNPDIALGNVYGSNMFNIVIIAVVDIVQGRGPVLYYVSKGHILTASIGMLLVGLSCVSILADINIVIPGIGIGLDSLLILLVFLGGLRLITRYERKNGGGNTEEPQYTQQSLIRAGIVFFVAGVLIVLAGRQLAVTANELSAVTGLGGTFIGSFLVAVTTSLPELVATLTAVRMGALDLAIGNILGANVMNMFIIVAADVFYRKGAFLSAVSPANLITGMLAISLMAIAVIGMIYRSEKSVFNLGFDSIGIVVLYILGAVLIFSAGMGI